VPERKRYMDEEMNLSEMLRELAEENQTRKILEILNTCKDLEEAKEKVKALLNK
jgi:DNA-binding transcriptional regulator GbsR (MarR family)